MPEKALTLSTLGLLEGGYFDPMTNACIRRAMLDCRERPMLDKPRIVTIQLEFTPAASQREGGSALGTVKINAKVQEKCPPRQTNGEYLDVVSGATADGEPEVRAVFAIAPLFGESN